MKKVIFLILTSILVSITGFGQGDEPYQPKITILGDHQVINCTSDPVRIGVSVDPWMEGYAYHWSNGESDSSILVKPTNTNVFVVTITNSSFNYSSTHNIEVRVLNAPVFSEDEHITIDKNTCPGRDVELAVDVSGGYAPYTYAWDFGSTDANPLVNPTENHTYDVTISDVCGSTVTAEVDIEFTPHDPIETPDAIEVSFDCDHEELVINPKLTGVSGGVGYGYKYSIDGWVSQNSDIELSAEDGTRIPLEITDACEAQFETIDLVLVKSELETPVVEDIESCPEETVELVSSDDPFYFWDGSTMHPSFEVKTNESKSYELMYIDKCGIEQHLRKNVIIESNKSGFEYDIVHFSRKVELYPLETEGVRQYHWKVNGELVSHEMKPELVLSGTDVSEITLETESEEGCVSTTTRDIIFQDGIDVPNAISPNGDGVNEYFSVRIEDELKTFNVKIFDRWGQLIYESNDQYFRWDASDMEGNEPISTFAYLIKAETIEGKPLEKRGTITSINAK